MLAGELVVTKSASPGREQVHIYRRLDRDVGISEKTQLLCLNDETREFGYAHSVIQCTAQERWMFRGKVVKGVKSSSCLQKDVDLLKHLFCNAQNCIESLDFILDW